MALVLSLSKDEEHKRCFQLGELHSKAGINCGVD